MIVTESRSHIKLLTSEVEEKVTPSKTSDVRSTQIVTIPEQIVRGQIAPSYCGIAIVAKDSRGAQTQTASGAR